MKIQKIKMNFISFKRKINESVKSQKIDLLSFRRTPDLDPGFAGMTALGLFTDSSRLTNNSLLENL